MGKRFVRDAEANDVARNRPAAETAAIWRL